MARNAIEYIDSIGGSITIDADSYHEFEVLGDVGGHDFVVGFDEGDVVGAVLGSKGDHHLLEESWDRHFYFNDVEAVTLDDDAVRGAGPFVEYVQNVLDEEVSDTYNHVAYEADAAAYDAAIAEREGGGGFTTDGALSALLDDDGIDVKGTKEGEVLVNDGR